MGMIHGKWLHRSFLALIQSVVYNLWKIKKRLFPAKKRTA